MTRFFDTNVLVYAYTDDPRQAVSKALISKTSAHTGIISVQVLNELTNVLLRKLKLPWTDIERALLNVRTIFGPVAAITEATHTKAIKLCRDHGMSVYDALIIAAALEASCDELLSEDMQHGRKFDQLTIINPFR